MTGRVIRIADRLKALEAVHSERNASRKSKAQRDELVRQALTNQETMARALAAVRADDRHRLAAIEAAMRADH